MLLSSEMEFKLGGFQAATATESYSVPESVRTVSFA